jgi:hypothetical protein
MGQPDISLGRAEAATNLTGYLLASALPLAVGACHKFPGVLELSITNQVFL